MAINENRKHMNIGQWTSSSRNIERFIIRQYKDGKLETEFEFRYKDEDAELYTKLIQQYISDFKEEACRLNNKHKYIYRLLRRGDEQIAVIVRLQ